jgi:O-antigen/teichoic acid export membrane protein
MRAKVRHEHLSMSAKPGTSIAPADVSKLTGGRLLARNTLWTVVGEIAPLAVGLVTIPIFVRELGVDRYGVLTLSYLVVGYLGLFDLGLGLAATQQISDALAEGQTDRIPAIFWTSMIIMFGLGIGAAAIITGMSHWLIYTILKIPTSMRTESVGVFLVLGTALPFVLSGSCLTGTLASLQRFDLTTAIGATTGIYSFIASLVVLIFTHNLVWIVAILVAGRSVAWVVGLILCVRLIPGLATNIRPCRKSLGPLLSFGGWITVSGITGPLMVYLDRFVIGSMLSIAAVSYYSVPYQIVTKLLILPYAMGGVLFPAFSATARRDSPRAVILFGRASRYAFLMLFPGVLVLFVFSHEVLALFFGVNFAEHGSAVMRLLLIGASINGLAVPPYNLLRGANRPDLTAKFHVAEAPIYLLLLFLLLPRYGVAGAALAWTLRVIVDAAALFIATGLLLPATKTGIVRIVCVAAIASSVVACSAMLSGLGGRTIYTTVALAIYLVVGWYRLLDSAERVMIRHKLVAFRFKDLVADQAA